MNSKDLFESEGVSESATMADIKNLHKLIAVRFSTEQAAHAKAVANAMHMSLSTLIRVAVQKEQDAFEAAKRQVQSRNVESSSG